MPTPPRVFISYSHDSPEHRDRVLALADRLRQEGIDAWIDRYEPVPQEGWPRWIERQIKIAETLLVVCSRGYLQRFRGIQPRKQELGAGWESVVVRGPTYEETLAKAVPVVFSPEDRQYIPAPLAAKAFFDVSSEEGFEALYRQLTGQSENQAPPVTRSSTKVLRVEDLQAGRDSILGGLIKEGGCVSSGESAWRRELSDRLDADGLQVLDRRPLPGSETDHEPWLVRARLPTRLRRLYGTAPEILVLVSSEEVKGRDLQRARTELLPDDLDLDPDLLVVMDPTDDLAERLRLIAPSRGQWVPWSFASGALPPLAEQLRRYLPAYDVFEVRDPVRGRQVIGREKVTADLSRRLRQGGAVGIFGLRKVGKTSAVRFATDHLDPVSAHLYGSPVGLGRLRRGQAEVLAVWLDCQQLMDRSLETLARRLVRELGRRLELEGFRLPTETASGSYLGRLEQLVEFALGRPEQPTLCFVLDEYDLLFERDTGEGEIEDIEKLFGLLRGYSQQTGRLGTAVIGRDPEFLERPKMGGRPNPMLQWMRTHWLGPLASEDADELLERLGRRVCLDVGQETKRTAFRFTGGHPLLHRQLGSSLLEQAEGQLKGTDFVLTDPLLEEATAAFLDRHAVITICREVADLLEGRYAGAAACLHDLSSLEIEELPRRVETLADRRRSDIRVLRNFGLLLGDKDRPWIPEVFRGYFRLAGTYGRRFTA